MVLEDCPWQIKNTMQIYNDCDNNKQTTHWFYWAFNRKTNQNIVFRRFWQQKPKITMCFLVF